MALCAVALVVLLVVLLRGAGASAATSFPDIAPAQNYYAAITNLAAGGIVSGYQDGTFGPDKPALREQFAKMVVGAVGLPVTEDDWKDANPPFTDCGPDNPNSLYPHDYIAVAKAYDEMRGKTATNFAPEATITRAEMVTVVVRAVENAGMLLKPVGVDYSGVFKDYNDPVHGANVHLADYNQWLLGGLVVGGDASSWMAANATRGEAAQVLWKLMWNIEVWNSSGGA